MCVRGMHVCAPRRQAAVQFQEVQVRGPSSRWEKGLRSEPGQLSLYLLFHDRYSKQDSIRISHGFYGNNIWFPSSFDLKGFEKRLSGAWHGRVGFRMIIRPIVNGPEQPGSETLLEGEPWGSESG